MAGKAQWEWESARTSRSTASQGEVMTTPQHPGKINFNNLENDYDRNGHNDLRDEQYRWNGPHVSQRRPALTNQQLAAIRDAAQAKGTPLTDAERADILGF
jgi:hypothetical protein